jgi:hypothetical protein
MLIGIEVCFKEGNALTDEAKEANDGILRIHLHYMTKAMSGINS